MPKRKSRKVKLARKERKEVSVLPVGPSSYKSLFYGIITVAILFTLVFLGLKLFPQRNKGSIEKEAAKTSVSQEKTEEEYTVQKEDSLWQISEKYYKTGYNWVDIAKANKLENPNILFIGTKLVIPKFEPKVVSQTTISMMNSQNTPDKITQDSYTVKRGDNLWTIAVRAYGDGFKWVEIARANNLANPDLIHSGNVLKLPR